MGQNMKSFETFAGYRCAFSVNLPLFPKTHWSNRITSCNSPHLPNLNGNQVYKFSQSTAVVFVVLIACNGRYANWFVIKTTTLTILANCHNMEHMWAASKCGGPLPLSIATTRKLARGFHDVLYFRFSNWFSSVSFMLLASSFHTNRM